MQIDMGRVFCRKSVVDGQPEGCFFNVGKGTIQKAQAKHMSKPILNNFGIYRFWTINCAVVILVLLVPFMGKLSSINPTYNIDTVLLVSRSVHNCVVVKHSPNDDDDDVMSRVYSN